MKIETIISELIEEFSVYTDPQERQIHVIELGKSLKGFDNQYKTEQFLIEGCQSQVWLHAKLINGKVIFTADSDAIFTSGIVSILLRVFSEQTPDDIIKTNIDFIDTIGLRENLSLNRSNGLLSMIKQMKLYAIVFKAKEERKI